MCLLCAARGWRGTPRHDRAPKACGHGMEEEGGPPTQQRAKTARGQGSKGATLTSQRAIPTSSQGEEEEGNPPKLQHVPLAHGMQERHRGEPPEPEEEGGPPPEQRAFFAHGWQETEGGGY